MECELLMKNAAATAYDIDIHEIDQRAVIALKNTVEFERLLIKFKPFLRSRVSRLAGRSDDMRADMMSVAFEAFFESVRSFNQQKGHFFQFMNRVVHNRLIDNLRKIYVRRVETASLEIYDEDDTKQMSLIDKVSIDEYREENRKSYFKSEIECLKEELAKWNISMDALLIHSPKHARLRDMYNTVAKVISNDEQIMTIINTKHYFPVKKISNSTKIPLKKIERGRIFILASLIILTGDYQHLKQYVA